MTHIALAKGTYLTLKDRLKTEYPDIDERTLADTVEGLTDLHEIVAAIVRAAITDEAMAEALRGRLQDMQSRLSRFEDRASKHRQIARDVMIEADLRKIMAPDLTISIRSGSPALIITDEAAIPEGYWVTREPRLDRQGLSADLKRGIAIVGAALSNPEPILSVRAK